MADRFWVGGSGNWDATSTANWSDTSGGTAGASAPTSADDVYFDANSNVGTGTFTVTVTGTSASPAVCKSFATGGTGGALDGAMTLTMGATAQLDCYGSMTLPATNFSISGTLGAAMNFRGTTSQTLTTNGVVMTNITLTLLGVGGTLTLGSALTVLTLSITNGTFDTSASNYNVTASNITSTNSNVRTINFNGSSISLSSTGNAINFTTATNLTFNAGTSTITCSGASTTFAGGGQTFYNVTFSSNAAGSTTITGANTYNNLTQTSLAATGIRAISVGANQTVNGTLTFGAANTTIRRIRVNSDTIGTQRTITLNGSLATLADVDFRDIVAAGTVATPWTGTRIGDLKNNSGITFDAPKTVYWNLAGTQNWSSTGWATTNNGTPNANNFPLPQDTATFTEAGAAGTVTMDQNWQIGSIQMADGVSNRTTAFTLATGAASPAIYGNVTLFSNLIFTGTGILAFAGQGVTQTFTSAGLTLTQPITVINVTGTFQLQDNLTLGSTLTTTLTSGTLNLNNNTLTTGLFSSNNSNTRAIAFGTGNITVTGNNNTVVAFNILTGFTYTGTPSIISNYSGSTGTRTIRLGNSGGASETNALSVSITAGSDAISIAGYFKNLIYSGYTGTATNADNNYVYGNLTLASGMTIAASATGFAFNATSGTSLVTTNGVTIDAPVGKSGAGATLQLQDNMTVGSTRTFTLISGTLDLTGNSGNWTLSTGLFASSNSNVRTIAFGTGNITVTGNNGIVFTCGNRTNITITGTPRVFATYAGSTGTRTINLDNGSGTYASRISLFVTAGTDTVTTTGNYNGTLDFTGFAGTWALGSFASFYRGGLILNSAMTINNGTNTLQTFNATAGTNLITFAGKTIDCPVTFNGIGGTWELTDALTLGSTRTLTITNGTLLLKNGVTSTVGSFATSGTNQKFLQSTLAGSQATLSQASGTVNASYLTIKDINATGGATWNAYFINNNVDAGNNTGWNFTDSPSNVAEFGMRLRSFTEPRRF